MFGLTQDQITSAVRWIITLGTGYLVGAGILTEGGAAALIMLAPGLAAFIWSMFIHSTNGTISAAAALPDVASVTTTHAIATSPAFVDNAKVTSEPL
jgi:hypothetical protein